MMYSMNVFETFDFCPYWLDGRRYALSKPRHPDKTAVTCEVYPSVFNFLYK